METPQWKAQRGEAATEAEKTQKIGPRITRITQKKDQKQCSVGANSFAFEPQITQTTISFFCHSREVSMPST